LRAAWRQAATIVAREASPAEAFAAIAEELGRLLGVESIRMLCYEGDRSALSVAAWGPPDDVLPVGARHPLGGNNATSRVFRTGQPARVDDYGEVATGSIGESVRSGGARCVVATPIVVEGRLWGAMAAGTRRDERVPPETEARLGQFTELMTTAIANAAARAEVERLADQQAGLRRVATLVAEGATPETVFAAVAQEMERLLDADQVMLSRYKTDAEVAILAHLGPAAAELATCSTMSLEGDNVETMVRRSRRPSRIDDLERARGPIAALARRVDVRAMVGAPIVVDWKLWGVVTAGWNTEPSPPADTEERMARFAQLVGTAVANADSRGQLTASRARLLTEADEARRRLVRDLHDGVQQRIVQTILTLKFAQQALRDHDRDPESLVADAITQAEQCNDELRELAHGILPPVLARGGLRGGVRSVVARLGLPVDVHLPAERFPAEIEASAYFIVAEALTNVVKHARASAAEVRASVDDGMLRLEIRDDGIGGADPAGHGLVGMGDRVTALGGRLEIDSPRGGGTLLTAALPLPPNVAGAAEAS
jgi:signal transduction histidine kinase